MDLRDPEKSPKLAVPVGLPEYLVKKALRRPKGPARQTAVAHLVNIAFYYLLRVGEYTATSANLRTRTISFRLKDITLRRGHNVIAHTAPLEELLTATEATLRIRNQKNGVKGQCIHNTCTNTAYSPIKSLAHRIHHIISNGGGAESAIATYYDKPNVDKAVSYNNISNAVREGAKGIGLFTGQYGYTPEDIGTHSLRAGGAMAMHLNGIPSTTIQKQGRWKSQTFLMYIHEQIGSFAAGISLKMATHLPFRQIAGPTLHDPP